MTATASLPGVPHQLHTSVLVLLALVLASTAGRNLGASVYSRGALTGLHSSGSIQDETVNRYGVSANKRPDPSEIIEPWRPYYMTHACEWTFLTLRCHPQRVINVVRATYGRMDPGFCSDLQTAATPARTCAGSSSAAGRIVSTYCDGHKNCTLPVYEGLFGDPCPDTFKYLEVYFACVADPAPTNEE